MLARWLFHLALPLALAVPARAEPPHLPLDRARLTEGAAHLRFEARWGGLHAGDFILTLNNGAAAYAGRFDMQTRGVIDWLIRLKILARSQGPVGAAHSLSALDYRVDYLTRSRDSWTAVRFDPGGGPATARQKDDRRDDNEDDPQDRPHAVPAELRQNTIDPLAAFFEAIRRAAHHVDGIGPAHFSIAVFDGLRRSELEGRYLGRIAKNVLGRSYELHQLRLTTHAVAGFRKRHRHLWDQSAFDVFLTADGRYIPIQMDSLGAGPTCNLVEICAGGDSCRLPKDE